MADIELPLKLLHGVSGRETLSVVCQRLSDTED